MKQNQKGSGSQSDSKSRQKKQGGKSSEETRKQNSPSKDAGRQDEGEGTKMPGRETRTPVAGNKLTSQEKNRRTNKGSL